jgi:hypothetical protein
MASRRVLKDILLRRVTSSPASGVRHCFSSSSSPETAPKIPHFSKKVNFSLFTFFYISGNDMRDWVDMRKWALFGLFSVLSCVVFSIVFRLCFIGFLIFDEIVNVDILGDRVEVCFEIVVSIFVFAARVKP